MTKRLSAVILALVLGVSTLYAGKGKVRIASDDDGAYVYIDGKKKAMIGEGFTSILLDEGEYTIKVTKAMSEQYEKSISKRVFVGEDSSVKITLNPDTYTPTSKYAKVLLGLDKPKLARWQRSGEIVEDTKLSLMWQDNSAAKSSKKKWKSAKKYCQNLSLAGYDSWRLPTYEELLTIVDYDRYAPAIVPSFQYTAIDYTYYWTTSVHASDVKCAWAIFFFGGGSASRQYKDGERHVRCVRGDR